VKLQPPLAILEQASPTRRPRLWHPLRTPLKRRRGPRGYALFVTIALACSSERLWSQTRPDFLVMHQAALQVLQAYPNETKANPNFVAVRDHLGTFEKILKESHALGTNEAAAVKHATTLLRAAAATNNVDEARAIVEAMNRDLTIKIQYNQARMGISGSSRVLAKVKVRTLRQGTSVDGLTVYCNPYRWANDDHPMIPFPRLSSPTETAMLPGEYRLFATRAGRTKPLAWRDVSIGLAGKDNEDVDLDIPNE
jgi:hypothetical protein